ncbi:MAG: hypothetical protein HRU24_07690 [Gammaproteobacteria bacterium]|nr:hypothetical protein [Gammaproteobacteria bacterium]
MPFAIVYSRAKVRVDAPLVMVEANLSNGLPDFSIVDLPKHWCEKHANGCVVPL